MSAPEHSAFCAVCERETGTAHRVALEDILEHLQVVHGIDATPEEWPDGEYVVIDSTLEPSDFEDERE